LSLELGLTEGLECGISLQKLSEGDPLNQNERISFRINGKYRIASERSYLPGLALLASINQITSNADYGIQAVFQKTFSPLKASLDLGYFRGKDSNNQKAEQILGGAGVIYPLSKKLNLLGELKTISSNSFNLISLTPGIRYFFSPRINLALGLELGICRSDLLWNLTAGLSLATSKEKDLESDRIPYYRKGDMFPKDEKAAEAADQEPQFKTPTPSFKLRIPKLEVPAAKDLIEKPETKDDPDN
jgi:hypothetical protein